MRRVVVSEFITLDGVIEDPGGSEGTPHGGWSLRFFSPEYGKYKLDELMASDALLLGRVTYEGFAAAWPSRTDEAGFADRMNSLPKYVVSTTLESAEWSNTTIVRDSVAEQVSKLKEQPGKDILVAGSKTLVDTLRHEDLVDEYRLMVFPIVLGSGKRLFGDTGQPTTLRLTSSDTFETGVVVLAYGPVRD